MINQRGQSIVQVLIGVALMGMIAAGVSSMLVNQTRETRALSETLAAMELQNLLTGSMANGALCLYALNNPTPKTFNSSAVATQAQGISFNELPATPNAGARPLAQVGQPASSLSSSLRVASIALNITSGSGTSYVGAWTIRFQNSVRAIKPVTVSVALTADVSAPAAARIIGCQGTSGGGGGGGGPSFTMQTLTCPTPGAGTCTVTCPAGTVRTGCSAGRINPQPNGAAVVPLGTNGCRCINDSWLGMSCYAYCAQ